MTTITSVRRESLVGGRVKGAMVRAHLQFVRDRLGETGAGANAGCAARGGGCRGPRDAGRRPGARSRVWSLLDRTIARVAGRDERELMRELGRYSAQINLSTIYRAFHRDDIHEFFRNSATLHRQFQDFGTCAYEHDRRAPRPHQRAQRRLLQPRLLHQRSWISGASDRHARRHGGDRDRIRLPMRRRRSLHVRAALALGAAFFARAAPPPSPRRCGRGD